MENGSASAMAKLQRVLRMNSGVGDLSYAKNSSMQKVIASLTKSTRQDLASDYYMAHLPHKITIADLGCSTGPNALLMACDVVQSVVATCHRLIRCPPEFQVFLNDLPWNDFNSIFRSLDEYYMSTEVEQHFFVSGVPGSFYGRVFPANSLNYAVSSSSLHWLSKVPEMLESKQVVNKGKIFISKASSCPSVADAYKMQFQEDFTLFLKCRSVEIVEGGVMILTFMGRRTEDPSSVENSYMWELLAVALMDLVSMGLVKEEKVDTFNAPYYAPSIEEVSQEITKEGSFLIKKIEIFEASYDALLEDQDFHEEEQSRNKNNTSTNNNHNHNNKFLKHNARRHAELTTKTNRAVLESMIRSHFGGEIMEELFKRYCDLLEEYYCENKAELTNILVAVERN